MLAPTCIVCRISFRNSLCWGPTQLALFVEFLFEILCVEAPPQLALFVEFLFEILCVRLVYAFYLLHKMVQVIYFSFSILSKKILFYIFPAIYAFKSIIINIMHCCKHNRCTSKNFKLSRIVIY